MRARTAGVQGALAAVGLVAAYLTWQRVPEDREAEVVVLSVSRSEVEKIRYEDERRWVEVLPARGDQVSWVREGTKPRPHVPPIAPDGGEPASPLEPERIREYRGSEAAKQLFDKVSPLRATRALGSLGEEKLKELGLSDTGRKLEISARGGSHGFSLSTSALGVGSPYLRSEADGKVYLLKGTLVSDLEFASSRLVDRRLHEFKPEDADKVVVSVGEQSRELSWAGGKLGVPGGPVDELATNWHEKIWRMGGVEVLGRGEEPPGGAPELQLRVEYRKGARPLGFIELGPSGSDVYARTEHTAGWVKLHSGAHEILREREKVLEGK
jgi:hypothetical protein